MSRTTFFSDPFHDEPRPVRRIREELSAPYYREQDDDYERSADLGEQRVLLAEIDRLRGLLAGRSLAPPDPAVDAVHRALATGYLAGLLYDDRRVVFTELGPDRTSLRFPEILSGREFTLTLTPDTDVPF